jgi:hypothetical protein
MRFVLAAVLALSLAACASKKKAAATTPPPTPPAGDTAAPGGGAPPTAEPKTGDPCDGSEAAPTPDK